MIDIQSKGEFELVALWNEKVRAAFLPAIGGKMVEFSSERSGWQFLLGPQTPDGTYEAPLYGADFAQYDTSGFDDCFPTVAESRYQLGERMLTLPDHGELWSRPWHYRILGDNELVLSVEGVQFDYRFTKRVALEGASVVIRYTLHNQSRQTFDFIWSAHPLLKAVPGAQILLPDQVDEVLLDWASSREIGQHGDKLSWPRLEANGAEGVNYARVQERELEQALKCFTPPLEKGGAGVYYPHADETLLFSFDPEEVPYLGLWLCYGGWPENTARKHYTLALEPATGRSDELAEAVRKDECTQVQAGAKKSWTLELQVIAGKAEK